MARGQGGQGNPYGALYMLLSLISSGLCVAILVIVNQDLWYGSYCYWVGNVTYCYSQNRCFMQTESSQSDFNLCYYSWAAGGVGLFFALCVFFFQVCSGRNRHIPTCEVFICLLSMLWWIAIATTATVYGKAADDVTVEPGTSASEVDSQALEEKQGYRTAVWAMGWANVGIWTICTLVSIKDCASLRGQQPPHEPAAVPGGYPTGAYTQSNAAYQQQPVYYVQPGPPGAYAPAGYPPAQQPFAGASPGYPPAQTV